MLSPGDRRGCLSSHCRVLEAPGFDCAEHKYTRADPDLVTGLERSISDDALTVGEASVRRSEVSQDPAAGVALERAVQPRHLPVRAEAYVGLGRPSECHPLLGQ